MSKILISLPQITPPAKLADANPLLTNISRLSALNPKELMALAVYMRAKELASDSSSPLTNYDPDVLSKRIALVQDSKAVIGNIPTGDIRRASTAIDWSNCKAVYGALPSDVDTLGALAGVAYFRTFSEDELLRMALYLRLEIGE